MFIMDVVKEWKTILTVDEGEFRTELVTIFADNDGLSDVELEFARIKNKTDLVHDKFSFYESLFIDCEDLATCLEDFVDPMHLTAIAKLQEQYLKYLKGNFSDKN